MKNAQPAPPKGYKWKSMGSNWIADRDYPTVCYYSDNLLRWSTLSLSKGNGGGCGEYYIAIPANQDTWEKEMQAAQDQIEGGQAWVEMLKKEAVLPTPPPGYDGWTTPKRPVLDDDIEVEVPMAFLWDGDKKWIVVDPRTRHGGVYGKKNSYQYMFAIVKSKQN